MPREKKAAFKKKRRTFERDYPPRVRSCRFCRNKISTIDYKDLSTIERMINERGKILSRRITGNCAKHQRKVSEAIKRARFIALIPYCR